METDKEDGELSEGERSSQLPAAQVNSNAHADTPRSVPQAPQRSSRVEEAYNPDRPAAGQQTSKESTRKASFREELPSFADTIQKQREEAKQFVKILNSNNIGYRALASEPLDTELLRGLYQSLNLPSEPAPILPIQTNGTAARDPALTPSTGSAGHSVLNNKVSPAQPTSAAAKIPVAPAPSTSSVPSPDGRKDYIARLQAAKLAKQAGGPKPSTPQHTPPAKSATPASAIETPQASNTPTTKPPVTDEQRARNTELIKQRLDAIRAKQPPPPAVSNGNPPQARRQEQSQVLTNNISQSTQPSTDISAQNMQVPSFPGIPGLFMSTTASRLGNTLNATKPPSSLPQKPPAHSDSRTAPTTRAPATSYIRPLGQSPHTNYDEEESMIIEVSDDESNGSDMDLDDDQSAPGPVVGSPKRDQPQRHAPGYLPNFPSRSGSTKPASSAVSTPGPQTPSTQAREKELEDKEKQLAAMRLTLKKKLAEKREKDKAAAAAKTGLPSLRQEGSPFPPYTPSDIQSMSVGAKVSMQPPVAASPTAQVPGDLKRLRRAEIQSQLPTLDAEIANNANKMARLTEEMRLLSAENERITKDKEQLTKELEDIGIDTEGMSHEELRAKKDEIEREQSPEKQTPDQIPEDFSHTPVSALLNGTSADGIETYIANDKVPRGSRDPPYTIQNTSDLAALPGVDKPVVTLPDSAASLPFHAESAGNIETVEQPTPALAAPAPRGSATPLDDGEDFYSPPPIVKAGLDTEVADTEAPHYPLVEGVTDVAKSVSEEGEIEMSESSEDEEEYEPDEPMIDSGLPMQDTLIQDSGAVHSAAASQVSTEDEEDYEPPDVDQEMADVSDERNLPSAHLIAPVPDTEEGAMDIASSSSEDSDDSDSGSDQETTPEPPPNTRHPANNVSQQHANIADDLAPELQPEPVLALTATDDVCLIPFRRID